MDVSETELKGQKSGPRLGKSTIAEDPLTRLWEKADASQGHHIEAVAQLRERKRREQGASRSRHRRRRKGKSPGPEAERVECERCLRTVRRASSERVEIPSSAGGRAAHLLCSRCADEVRHGLLRLLAGQEPLPAPDPGEREVPLSIPARAGWFAFRMTAYGVIALVAFTLVTWLVLR